MTACARRFAAALAIACVALLATPLASAATGDVNADGRIDIADALALCRALSGAGGPVVDPTAADVDADGDTDDQDVRLLLLAALGQRLPVRTFSVEPDPLDFTDVLVGMTSDLQVTLTNEGTLPLSVLAIALDPSGSPDFALVAPPAVPTTVSPGAVLDITVRYTPGQAGADLGALTFLTDAGSASVALVGLGISPLLDVTPATLEFGDVAVGSSDTASIEIANTGDAPLTVQSVAPGPGTSPDFSVGAPGQTSLAPGASTQVSVTYTPTEAGVDTGRIDILSDGGSGMVALAGRGVAPQLDLVPDTLDFGAILVGTNAGLFFDVRNAGTAPLEVTSMTLSLDTAPAYSLGTLPALPFTVLPGESTAIQVVFAPSSAGPATGRVDVATNAGGGQVALVGSGVRPEIALTPGTADFGNVLVGATGQVLVEIANTGSAPLTVTSVALAAGASVDFAIASGGATPFVLDPGESHAVVLAYAPAEVGPDTGTLNIDSNDPVTPLATVPLQGNGVSPDFVIQPAALDFGSVRVGSSADLSFEILNSGGTSLSVETVGVGAGSLVFSLVSAPSLPHVLAPSEALSISVRFAPSAGGPALGRIDVTTSAGSGEVPLSGVGTLPALALIPDSVDFGSAPLGGQVDRTVQVHNAGTAALTLSDVVPLGASAPTFTVVSTPPLPAVIPPGSSVDVVLRFAPAAAGPASGAIRFASDDPVRSAVDLPVSGNGLAGGFLETAPTSVDFGELPIGVNGTTDLTLTNVGDAALSILSVGFGPGTSAEFTAGAPSTTTLGAGATALLSVSYRPVDAGADAGTLAIATSANALSVPLAGRGAVGVTPVALALDVTAETLTTDECLKLHATAQFSDGSFADVSSTVAWSSGATSVATVDGSGLVVAVGTGPATITAALGALTAQSAITVEAAGSVRVVVECGEAVSGGSLAATLVIDSGVLPLGAYAVRLTYDPGLIVLGAVAGGPAVGPFSAPPFSHPPLYPSGSVVLAAWQASSLTAPLGSNGVAHLTFQVSGAAGASGRIGVEVLELVGTDLTDLAFTTSSSRVGVAP